MFIFTFFIAFFISFIGSASPSMLNISCLKISLESGLKNAQKYAAGISLVIIFQAYIGIFIAKEIDNYPNVISFLEQFSILIFFCLSYYFFRAYKNQKKVSSTVKNEIKKPFIYGLVLSAINMFAIPFYFGAVTSLHIIDLFSFDAIPKLFFAIGSSIGTFFILLLYAKYANSIDKKLHTLTKNINLILSILTLLFAALSLLKKMI